MTNKTESKMAVAKVIYDSVVASGTESVRKEFMSRVQTEVGLTKAGASSYHQMLKSASEGKDMYRHHKSGATTTTKPTTASKQVADAPQRQSTAKMASTTVKPWQAQKDGVTERFTSRNEAREFNKANGGGWAISK